MLPNEPQIRIHARDGDCVIEIVTDSLMHEEAPHIARYLLNRIAEEAEPGQRVVFDFSRVVHMNSNAVSVLLIAKKALEDEGRALALRGVSPTIHELFRFMCLDKAFTFIDA